MPASRNTVNEAIEAWRALDVENRDRVVVMLENALRACNPERSGRKYIAALALLRAASEPEAKATPSYSHCPCCGEDVKGLDACGNCEHSWGTP